MDYDTWLAKRQKNHLTSFRAIWYEKIQWLDIDIVVFFVKNRGKRKYFCAAVEEVKHWKSSDTLNYTNIQFKASIQFVWNTNADWKSLILLLLPAVIRHRLKRRCRHDARVQNIREWDNEQEQCLQLFTIINTKNTSTKQRLTCWTQGTNRFLLWTDFRSIHSHSRRTICCFTYLCGLIVGM